MVSQGVGMIDFFLNQSPALLPQMLKRICDHPALLNERAIETIDESREQLSRHDSLEAEKVAGAMAGIGGQTLMRDMAASCKMSFLLPLLVSDQDDRR